MLVKCWSSDVMIVELAVECWSIGCDIMITMESIFVNIPLTRLASSLPKGFSCQCPLSTHCTKDGREANALKGVTKDVQ